MRPIVVVLVLSLALAACSGDPEPAKPAAKEPPRPGPQSAVPPKQTQAARSVLARYLRGVAAGDTKVCASLAPAYDRAIFGKPGGCRSGLGAARARLRPKDVAALRAVAVPAAEPGPGPGEYTVRFEDLQWKGEPARPGGVLAARFTLRPTGKRWLIVP